MNKLLFACPWQKNKQLSWSGTHWALYMHLKKKFEIIEMDTSVEHNRKNPYILSWCLKNKLLKILGVREDDMGIGRFKVINKIAQKKFNDVDYPVLMFEESPILYGRKEYIYQDLHVGYVKKMYEEMPEVFKESNYSSLGKAAINAREIIQRDFYKKTSGILTMGKWLAEELINEYGIPANKVFHVGGGCNIDISLIDDSKKEGNKILFVGRDFERKNGPLVVEAFKILHQENKNLELYIVGPKEVNITGDGIKVLGDLNYAELIHYFNICDIFCMPSKFEAYGLVFAEALAFGLPCIGRDAFEMPYFIEENKTGYLLKSDSKEELSVLMKRLLENEEIKNNVKLKRNWYIKEYSWDNVSDRISTIINE